MAAREAAGLTLEQVGNCFGITAQAVQQWEKGITEPSATRLGQLAAILNCSADVLLAIVGKGKP